MNLVVFCMPIPLRYPAGVKPPFHRAHSNLEGFPPHLSARDDDDHLTALALGTTSCMLRRVAARMKEELVRVAYSRFPPPAA